MKKYILVSIGILIFLSSCSNSLDCRALNNSDFRNFFGSFESYGSELSFYSTLGDTVTYQLITNYSDGYSCEGTNAKDCICDADKTLKSPSAESNFTIDMNAESLDGEKYMATVFISTSTFSSRFRAGLNSEEGKTISGNGYYQQDTTILGESYALVFVENNNAKDGNFILDQQKGVVGYKDIDGTAWYRIFP